MGDGARRRLCRAKPKAAAPGINLCTRARNSTTRLSTRLIESSGDAGMFGGDRIKFAA